VRDTTIDAARRGRVIDTLLARLEASYVFPEKVPALAKELRARIARGRYDRLESAVAFADTLTADLLELVKDRHLRVRYTDTPLPRTRPQERPPTPAEQERTRAQARAESYGLGRVELTPDSIGFLEVRDFGWPADAVEEGYAEAMRRVAHAHALIIDIRRNGGGTPYSVALLSSYLLAADSIHLNSIYWRAEDRTEEFWTRRVLAGPRYGSRKPLVILTSNRTFSAAEEFAYNLQAMKRAVIVGEVTRGGANPGQGERLDDHFFAFVPTGRAINPVTHSNWEGVGVQPAMKVAADRAEEEALRLIREPRGDAPGGTPKGRPAR
jgi:C-terminal processing protease CtpA/Prc